MNLIAKGRNVVRGLLQLYGPQHIKRSMWNHEFTSGRWTCLESSGGDCVYPYLEKYASGGRILDLGCGPGTVGIELNDGAYSSYTGVDISDVAIDKARKRMAECGVAATQEYAQCDIETYLPSHEFEVVLFGDSLYYIPHHRIAPMLHRYSNFLSEAGVFVARLFEVSDKHRPIVDIINNHFEVLEQRLHGTQVYVMVFRPRTRTGTRTVPGK